MRDLIYNKIKPKTYNEFSRARKLEQRMYVYVSTKMLSDRKFMEIMGNSHGADDYEEVIMKCLSDEYFRKQSLVVANEFIEKYV